MSRLNACVPAALSASLVVFSPVLAIAQESPAAPATNETPIRPVNVSTQRPRPAAAPKQAPRRTVAPPTARAPVTSTASGPPGLAPSLVAAPAPIVERYQLPQTTESRTAEKIEQTTNIVDTADAVKYLPSLFVRKRNYGDNQAVLATRTWGLNSSARSLIYVDDILISNLQGNNNSNASPRWGMVAPEEIQRIDFMYGPFAAMYPGNSIGGVLQITTRMPDKPEWTFKQTEAFQTFDFYKTKGTFRTDQTSASFGNRWNDLAVFVSANYQNSFSQPLAWVTTAGTPAGTTGTIPQLSRIGATANVLGAGGLLHTEMLTLKGKAALDITDWLKATYNVGLWSNDQKSNVETYLRDAAGNPTFGGNASVGGANFASNYYNLNQVNLANALSLKTNTRGNFDWDIAVSHYEYLKDIQRNPFTVAATGASFINTGKIARLDGTNWTNADAMGIWRPTGPGGAHEVSFGVHGDRYELKNPVYKTAIWFGGPDVTSELYTNSFGKTQTTALWVQDAWRFAPQWKFTVGGRWENWRGFDGFNLNTTTSSTTGAVTGATLLNQPTLNAARFSPKASLAFEPNKDWQVTGSFGVANRFPTVTELYQITTVAGNLINPNPNLVPERALTGELAIERKFADGKVRLSLFQENTHNMLISQSNTIPGTTNTASFVTNVDEACNRGVELAWQKNNVLIERMELFGSVTYVDSIILSDPTFVGTALPGGGTTTAVGKHVPNVPEWRSTLGATYRPTDALAMTLVGRYQSKIFATLDNIDVVPNVFQAFDRFFVVDTRIQYKATDQGTISVGIDNIGNAKYHLFHPFPQRTLVIEGKLKI
jgi:iron complex outermembrane recepter protein